MDPGYLHLNFAWYKRVPSATLPTILTDTSGHTHRWSVQVGGLRPDVWLSQKEEAAHLLSPAFAELIAAVDKPFVQVISDCRSPRALSRTGRVILVGDALAMNRPHTGEGVSQAAAQVLLLEKWVQGRISLERWEEECIDAGWLGVLKSRAWGHYYMSSRLAWLAAAAWYRVAARWVNLKKWWRGF